MMRAGSSIGRGAERAPKPSRPKQTGELALQPGPHRFFNHANAVV